MTYYFKSYVAVIILVINNKQKIFVAHCFTAPPSVFIYITQVSRICACANNGSDDPRSIIEYALRIWQIWFRGNTLVAP